MLLPLDGPSNQGKLSSVDTVTVVEAKNGASAFEERKVISFQATGRFYYYFGDGSTVPNAATVSSDGFLAYKDTFFSVEASCHQPVYVLAVTGTVDIVIAERG